MLSSNSSSVYNPMTNYNTEPFTENDISSSTSKLEDPFLFTTFPTSPHDMHLEYDLQFLDCLFYQHQSITTAAHDTTTATNTADSNDQNAPKEEDEDQDPPAATTAAVVKAAIGGGGAVKRCSKKDRHSKINTARGPRDRRMRLSLDVARKFFDLQDMLGYDKASRTVEWLLKNSRAAIRELAVARTGGGGANSTASSTCDDCEVVSRSKRREKPPPPSPSLPPPPPCGKQKRARKVIKAARATVPRESRRKARERARERTSQKRRLSSTESTTEPKLCLADDHHQSSSLFSDRFKESAASFRVPICGSAVAEIEDLNSDERRIIGSTVFHHQDINAILAHQVAGFQFCGKPWEAYNSYSNLSG